MFGKKEFFLKNFGEFLQNYNSLRSVSDFYSEHDKSVNGGIFFGLKIGLYYRNEFISMVKVE